MTGPIEYPDGRRFAFTILDDTDDATLENVRPIYDLLQELGLRTTKTVWTLDSPAELKGDYHAGETLEDEAYRDWVLQLERAGFEIAFHNASMIGSDRAKTRRALDVLDGLLERSPRLHCNHGQNDENLYWGVDRYSGPVRLLFRLAAPFVGSPVRYEGHVEGSPYFWGDIAREHFDYVRAFAFRRLNGARIPPGHPYLDPERPWVRCWFNTADAPTVAEFRTLVTEERIRRLRDEGGWCIVSTHLGKGFVEDGRVDPDVERILRVIAAEPGWFVPASELLDHLCNSVAPRAISPAQRVRLEAGHALDRVASRVGG